MEKEWQSLIIVTTFFALSLMGAVVLFSYLESYAEVAQPTYKLGGAVAGFFVILVTLATTYSRFVAKPTRELMGEASRAITKPKGFVEHRLPESGFAIYYPKNWEVEDQYNFPTVKFSRADNEKTKVVMIETIKPDKDEIKDFLEKDASNFFDSFEKYLLATYKGMRVVEKRKMALHGMQCPLFVIDQEVEGSPLRSMGVAYFDVKREIVHVIYGATRPNEFENARPIFEKMISTFRPI